MSEAGRGSIISHHVAKSVNHLSTFDPELRNVSFALITFMGFPTILSALQPFQFCIFKRKYSKLTFSNGYQLMGKRFTDTFTCIIGEYMQKEFPRFPPDFKTRDVDHLSTFDPELRNVSSALISFMGFPAI